VAGGAAVVATTGGSAGKVARASGTVVANTGDRLQELDQKHQITSIIVEEGNSRNLSVSRSLSNARLGVFMCRGRLLLRHAAAAVASETP
jgi:hypothetical protein